MNVVSHTLNVAWKEIQLLLKDRGQLAVLFLLPILFSSLYGSINMQAAGGRGNSLVSLDVCLVNQDEGIFGDEIAKVLGSIDELDVETFDVVAEAERRVAQGEAAAAIVVPAGFSPEIAEYVPTTIEVVVDPGQPESADIVMGIMNQVVAEVTIWGEVQYGVRSVLDGSGLLSGASAEAQRAVHAQTLGAIMTQLSEMRRTPAIVVATEDLEGAAVTVEGALQEFFAFLFPAITVMFIFFVVGVAAVALLTERETGTLRRLMAGPIPRGAIVAGKMVAYVLLVCLQVAVMFGVGSIFFRMPLGRSPLGLVALTVLVALVATAIGMLVAALVKTPKQADNIGLVLGFVLGGISFSTFGSEPVTRSEGFLAVLARLTPHGHAIEGYYRLMAESATLLQILPEIGILSVMVAVFYGVAVWRFRFE
ncbi:MAG: ABC transporter permease [Anaerolineae bacterium]|jgi:ABC-2 type transport system permease protein